MGGFNRAGGSIGGGTGVSSANPTVEEMAAQIRLMATKAASSTTYSNITSLLDPMYDLFKRSEKKDPSVAEGVAKWVYDKSTEMKDNFEKGAEKIFDTGVKGAEKIFDRGVKGAQKFIEDPVEAAQNVVENAQKTASKIFSDLVHNPGDLFC
jgi:hypothetical protein